MSFFQPPPDFFKTENPKVKKDPVIEGEEIHKKFNSIPSGMVIIDGTNLIKIIEDNSDIKPGKTDIGIMAHNHWQPCNYNPTTGEII